MRDNVWEFVGSLDRIDLMHTMLSHPDTPVRIEVGDQLVEVADFRYLPNRGGLVLLLHEATEADFVDWESA
jgi:hypothetical protein